MKSLEIRLTSLKKHVENENITIMILGLGSVGTYLLDYLLSSQDSALNVVVVGRNFDKMDSDVNIVKVASAIRHKNNSKVLIESGVDFENINQIATCIKKYNPDFIVNTSRVYAGLKYGSLSWKNVRAYGIWSPLSIKYIRNIMLAASQADTNALVINTSYSDAVIPWLKSAGQAYPDFGSGNGNHLIPRIRFAIAEQLNIPDFWNIDVMYATSHFHDVVISKEGQVEGIKQLIQSSYNGNVLNVNYDAIFKKCSIAMPTDAKRNMMNASSNYDIIMSIISAIREKKTCKFFSPGAFGEIGGYPILVDGRNNCLSVKIDDSVFSIEEMRAKNHESIYLDGIENIKDGVLYYTDELLSKVKNAFGVELVKSVPYDKINETVEFIINQIIVPTLSKETK